VMLALSAFAAGCDEQKSTPAAPSATASAPVEASATASAASPAPTASAHTPGKGKMANCPNAVEGATTDFKDVDKGIEILVTAKAEGATKDIRARAKHMADVSKDASRGNKAHDGSGQGGGQFGRCPVVLKNTKVAVEDAEGGAKLTVTIEN